MLGVASTAPLVALIRKHVLAAAPIHGDDTAVPLLAQSSAITGRRWTYVRDDKPFGDPAPPAALFVAVPGFAARGLAAAMTTDGTKLLPGVERSGFVRIAGTFAGPVGAIEVAGGWAVAGTSRDVAILRLVGSTPPSAPSHDVQRLH